MENPRLVSFYILILLSFFFFFLLFQSYRSGFRRKCLVLYEISGKLQDKNSVSPLQPSWLRAWLRTSGRFSSPWERPGPLQWRGLSLTTPWGLVFKHPGSPLDLCMCFNYSFEFLCDMVTCNFVSVMLIRLCWLCSIRLPFPKTWIWEKPLGHFVALQFSWHVSVQSAFSRSIGSSGPGRWGKESFVFLNNVLLPSLFALPHRSNQA